MTEEKQCYGKKKSGERCERTVYNGDNLCYQHEDQEIGLLQRIINWFRR